MKNIIRLAATVGLGAFTTLAQPPPGGPGGPGGPHGGPRGRGHPPVPPLIVALDADKHGGLSVAEIANASVALKTLDKNGDGKIATDELRPPMPGGTNQFGFTPPAGPKPPLSPIMAALDQSADGELDATEIGDAGPLLLKLDANGDGALSQDELRPKDQGGPGSPGGPGGPGGHGGPGGPDDSGGSDQPQGQ